jgi:hypothetical protein
MPLKALDNHGDGTWADVAEAIIYAADNGARVLNLSLGGTEFSETLQAAVSYAQSRGCLLVAAAGNSNSQPAPVEYPAALLGVLAVAATTEDDEPAYFSNRGPEVDVAAPGVNIYSANKSGSYYFSSGTSPAAAHVSGVAALVWSLRPGWTADQVAGAITSTAHDVYLPGPDQRSGSGRVDARATILQVVEPQVGLAADRPFVVAGGQGATLTATVTTSPVLAAPDGFPVTFQSNMGVLAPPAPTTLGGQATTTFTSTQCGQATITAHAGPDAQATTTISVVPGPVDIDLAADRAFLLGGEGGVTLTATVAYSQGQPAADGLLVTFATSLGRVEPPSAPTLGGQVTATLTSTRSGEATVTARLGPDTQDSLTLGVVLEPRVALAVDRPFLLGGDEGASLTATVTYSQGGAVPDGFPVTFLSTLGSVEPPTATTEGGLAVATFTSRQCGQAAVTAHAGPNAQDTVAISLPCRFYLPAIYKE